MKIVVDQNITAAENTFAHHGEIILVDGRRLKREQLTSADALIIRTTTKANAALLDNTPVGFVGSASIGTDHMDIPWLEESGINWANAPGSTATSAAQYSLAMIWLACQRLGFTLADLSVGVIGRGNVGSRVQRLLTTMGATVVANDPPLADRGETGLVSLDEALAQDIICLHVPLTRDGPYPTWRFIDRQVLARMPDGALLLNAARGDVIDGDDLLPALQSGRLHAALDVWPGEPLLDGHLLERTVVATPHVAGYSSDGRRNGAQMVYRAFCAWAGEIPVDSTDFPDEIPRLTIRKTDNAVSNALNATCFVAEHDHSLHQLSSLSSEQRAIEFDHLRRNYPQRRDFQAWQIRCEQSGSNTLLRELGFAVE